ncbi:uncharacterized protein JCM6883_001099 [Sporobolomyces salmoneus]|uniref:uncharacterized protein n=1 Tax=Sporobolomyces salmoneus TaxID=183962 RepID=UPI00316F019E
MSNTSFAQAELRQALSEVETWGIKSARIVDEGTSEKASAKLVLREGDEVVVECSESGWVIVRSPVAEVRYSEADLICRPFDTLDDLLLAVSPEFEQKRMEKLFERLSKVAEERRESAVEEDDLEYGDYDDGVEHEAGR